MVQVLDEHFTGLLRDIGGFISGICSVLEFALGVSYFCGEKLASWITLGFLGSVEFCSQVAEALKILGSELWDFGGEIIRGILLVYYGICVIFDAFYTTASDLKWFTIHVFTTIGEQLISIQNGVLDYFGQVFNHFPSQIVGSISFVGDGILSFFKIIGGIFIDFITQLVLAPLKVLQMVGIALLHVAYFPLYLYNTIPLNTHIGFIGLAFICLLFWKLGFTFIYRKAISAVRSIFAGIYKMLVLIKNSKSIVVEIMKSGGKLKSSRSNDTPVKDSVALCVVCKDETVCYITQPCKHVCLCRDCVYRLPDFDNRCPICRQYVRKFERVYIPS